MVKDLGHIPKVSADAQHRAAVRAAAWCVRHEDDPAEALAEILMTLGIIDTPSPTQT